MDVHDACGYPRAFGGDVLRSTVLHSSGFALSVANCTDFNDGTYRFQFLPTLSGRWNVTITLPLYSPTSTYIGYVLVS